jgi:hypothetical protein
MYEPDLAHPKRPSETPIRDAHPKPNTHPG